MFFFVNLLGLVVFLGIGVLASRNRKEIQWRSVASLLTLNLVLAWFPDIVPDWPRYDYGRCERVHRADQHLVRRYRVRVP